MLLLSMVLKSCETAYLLTGLVRSSLAPSLKSVLPYLSKQDAGTGTTVLGSPYRGN
ncbi:MAG: hypothetical protein RLZZ422_982 [Pseudomonadota bacterium]|jgi:hypothetical protein